MFEMDYIRVGLLIGTEDKHVEHPSEHLFLNLVSEGLVAEAM
jgi:hypothetical protein